MGLDVAAFRQILRVHGIEVDRYGHPIDDDNYMKLDPNADFPAHSADIASGIYTQGIECHTFNVGIYCRYDMWREELARFAGYPSSDGGSHSMACWSVEIGPFWELINFSDSAGLIGPMVSAKLLKDFKDCSISANGYRVRTENSLVDDEYFQRIYCEFTKAFELAADGGLVVFC